MKPTTRSHCTPFSPLDFDYIRQILQFITLVWQVEGSVTDFFTSQSISFFLRNLLQKFSGSDKRDPGWDDSEINSADEILPTLVTALAAMEFAKCRDESCNQVDKLWDDGIVWKLMVDCSPDDVLATCRFDAALHPQYTNAYGARRIRVLRRGCRSYQRM